MATVLEIAPGVYARMGYTQVLDTLDAKIDGLARIRQEGKRLAAGTELLVGLYGFSQELQGRCLALKGVLELRAKVD